MIKKINFRNSGLFKAGLNVQKYDFLSNFPFFKKELINTEILKTTFEKGKNL